MAWPQQSWGHVVASPTSHRPLPHTAPQSRGHEDAVSPDSQTPLPHTGPDVTGQSGEQVAWVSPKLQMPSPQCEQSHAVAITGPDPGSTRASGQAGHDSGVGELVTGETSFEVPAAELPAAELPAAGGGSGRHPDVVAPGRLTSRAIASHRPYRRIRVTTFMIHSLS